VITQIKRDQLRDGLIVNEKVAPSAGIVYSKLNLTNSIQGTDLTSNSKQTVLEYKLQGYWDKIENFITSVSNSDNITKNVEQAATIDTHTIDGSSKGVLTSGQGAWGSGINNYKGQMRLHLNGDAVDDGENGQVYFELHHENYIPLSGTISWTSGSTTVTGSSGTGGTQFTTELEVGSVLIVNEEVLGTVASITNDTSLELTSAPSSSGVDQSYARQSAKGTVSVSAGSTSVSGTNTKFTSDFEVGDALVNHDTGNTVGYIASITSDTAMTLESGASEAINGTADKRQYKAYYKKRNGDDFTFSTATAIDMLFIEVYDEYTKPLLASAIGYGFVDVVGVTGSHNHDDRYYTKTQLGSTTDGTSGADLVGFTALTQTGWSSASTVQQAIENVVADLSDTTSGSSGASLIGVEASGNLTSTDVQDALEELQSDIDTINNTMGSGSLDDAYNNGSVVDVDATDVDWQLTDGKKFKVSTEATGNASIFEIDAEATGDTVSINADTTIDGILKASEISKTVFLSQFSSLQSAIDYLHTNYDGGTVIIDSDNYDISSETPIAVYSNITLKGYEGRETTLTSTNTSNYHITGADINNVQFIDLHLYGPGQSATGGGGIFLTRSANANIAHVYMKNVTIEECANSGLSINTPILSTFINVKVVKVAGHGFNVWGGTSCNFINCYGITTTQAGFALTNMTYSHLSGCASEACGISYDLENSNNIVLDACGSEDTLNRSSSYPGYAFKLAGNNITMNSCYSKDSVDTAVYITGSNITVNGFKDAYVSNNPTYSIDNTNGGSTTIIESSFAKSTNFNNQTKVLSGDTISTSGEFKLQDSRTSAIPFSDVSNTTFADGTSTSIIGAINAAYNAATGANTLDEVYDGETGNRVITMDNGSVEWQITDGYEHNFADASGNDILSVKALAAGDEVDITGKLSQSSGQVTFGGNVDAEAGLDVTGADLTVGGSNFSVDVSNGNTTVGGTLQVSGDATLQSNLVVSGNLTVQGTQTVVNTETIELADNIIVLNSNFTGSSPTENAGIEVERGTATNVQLFWDEANDAWAITDLTGTYYIAKTSGTGGALSLDEAYNGGSTIDVDTTDVDWQLTDGRKFQISTEDTGNPGVVVVSAAAGGDTVEVTADTTLTGAVTQSSGQVTFGGNVDANGGIDVTGDTSLTGAVTQSSGQVTFGGNVDANGGLDVTGDLTQQTGAFTVNANAASSITTSSGNLSLNSAADLQFKDQYLTSYIPISESGTTGLSSSFTATSIVGALNELKNDILSIQWKSPVNTYNDLPATGNSDGDVRLVLDTEDIYEWDGTESEWKLISAGAENWLPSVESKNDLPTTGNRDGDVRLVKQLGAMYYWDASDSGWKPFETGTAVDLHYAREDYTATSGQTVFNLGHSYQRGKNTLLVFVNGDLKKVSDDYVETDDTTVTFNSGLTAGDKVTFIIGFAPNNFYGEINTFTASDGQTVFNLSFSYLQNNDEIEVFRNGLLMVKGSSDDYVESSSTSITFNTGLHSGDRVVVRKARDYTKALNWTGDYASFTATAGQTQFDWSTTEGWTYTNGAHEIEVFKNGVLQLNGASEDYQEDGAPGSIQSSITFNSGLTAGDKVYIRKAGNYGLSNHDHDLLYTRTVDLNSTANGKGASIIGIEDASDHFTSTNVEGALNELYTLASTGNQTLDETYDQETGNRIITMDNGSVEWQITDGYEHNFADASGTDILSVKALSAGDQVVVNGIFTQSNGQVTFGGNVDANSGIDVTGALNQSSGQVTFGGNVDANGGVDVTGDLTQSSGTFTISADSASSINVTSASLGLTTTTSGDIELTSAGDIKFDDSRTASAITLSDASNTSFVDGVSTSLIGAINAAYNAATGANTLDEVYDGETGNRIITMDNGSVEWQITDGYEHNFADDSGNDILSVKALATGDEVDITGKLDQSGGSFSLDGNAASTIKTSSGDLTVQSAAELIFTDSRVSNIPFTAAGVTGLSTTAQNIIGAINEAFEDAIKLGYEEQQPSTTEAANDYIVLEDSSVTDLLPAESKTLSELRDMGIFMSVYLNGVLLSQYEVSYGYLSGEKRIEFDGTGAASLSIESDDVIVVKIIKKAQ